MWADFQPQSKGLCVKIYSAEPDLNQWPRDGFYSTTVSRSANWAIGGTHLRNSEWTQGINISYCKQIVNAKKRSLRAGFEPAREDPIGFQVQRLNHSAITAPVHFERLNGVHSFCYYIWKLIIKAKGRKGNQFFSSWRFYNWYPAFSRLLVALLGNRRCAYRWHWALNSFKRKRFFGSKPHRTAPFFF